MDDIDQAILDDGIAFDIYREGCIHAIKKELEVWVNDHISTDSDFSLAHNFVPGFNPNDHLVKRALENGYKHFVIYLGILDVEICVVRVEGRTIKGLHMVDEQEIRERYIRGLKELNEVFIKISNNQTLNIDIDKLRVIDNSLDDKAVMLLDYTKSTGTLQILTDDEDLLSKWKQLLPKAFNNAN